MSGYKPSLVSHAFARGRALEHVLSTINSPGKYSTPEKQPTPVSLCICRREKQKILCRSCGAVFDGRIRKQCVIHPNEIHLMDILCCPQCKTNYLQEIGGSSPTLTPEKEPELLQDSPGTEPVRSLEEERARVDSDRVLLRKIGKKIEASSAENWEDELANTSLENLEEERARVDSDRMLLRKIGKKIEASSAENWEDELANTSLENLRS